MPRAVSSGTAIPFRHSAFTSAQPEHNESQREKVQQEQESGVRSTRRVHVFCRVRDAATKPSVTDRPRRAREREPCQLESGLPHTTALCSERGAAV